MRQDTDAYILANTTPQKAPRFVVELAFDLAGTDLHYFTSHSDAALPVGASVIHSVVTMNSVTQQKLNVDKARATIGNISFNMRDKGGAVSALFASKFASAESLKGRKVAVYRGYEGLAWDDYVPVTQIITGAPELEHNTWRISCSDLQRELRKDLFDLATTVLTASISASATTLNVVDTSDFEMVAHGTSYSDAPSQTVGYIKIEDEVIRYTGKTSTSFTGCTRGVMNTVAAEHNVDGASSNDNKLKVDEFVYIELPAIQAAYELMTGGSLPTRWHLGIDSAYVRQSDFNNIGIDLYNPANDEDGVVFRFEGLKKTDGKKFIEEQLFQPLGLFSPVYSDGALGLKRINVPLSSSSYVAELDPSNTVRIAPIRLDYDGVHNWVKMLWNWDHNQDRFTRPTALIDANSINTHGISEKPVVMEMRGLHGSRHSSTILQDLFDYYRWSYSGPPWLTQVECMYGLNGVEIGDFVRLNFPDITDPYTGAALDRVVRVDGARDNPQRGTVTLDVFGATEASLASDYDGGAGGGAILPDSWYTSEGTELSTVLTINVVGDVGHVTAGGTLTGGGDMNAAGSIFYYDGDLTIDPGVEVFIDDNVQLRVKGHLTVDGKINGKGRGLAGAAAVATGKGGAPGTVGYFGTTEAMGGIDQGLKWLSTKATPASAKNKSAPKSQISWDGGTLLGIEPDQRGTSGGSGLNKTRGAIVDVVGADGANGGAALAVVCRGASLFGSSGQVDLSGDDGAVGEIQAGNGFQAGSSAGGAPGILRIILDGDAVSANYPVDIATDKFVANQGVTPIPSTGTRMSADGEPFLPAEYPLYSYHIGINNDERDLSKSAYMVQYIPPDITAEEDPSTTVVQPPGTITPASGDAHAVDNGDGTYLARIYATCAPSSDPYLKGYRWEYKQSSDSDWIAVTGLSAKDSPFTYITPVTPGVSYDVRVAAVNRFGNESTWETFSGHPAVGRNVNPTAPTSLTVVGKVGGFQLDWSAPTDSDVIGTQIIEASTNDRDQGTTIGTLDSDSYFRKHDSVDTRYYWVRHKNRWGLFSDWYPASATGGVSDASLPTDYGDVTNTPNNLSDINTSEGDHLGSIAYQASADITFIASSGMSIQGNSIVKTGGGTGWNEQVYTTSAWVGSAYVEFKPDQADLYFMMGLNTDPTTDSSYTTIDYAWYCIGDGTVKIYESGSNIGSYGAYTTDTVFSIVYDGQAVKYYMDGVLKRTVSVSSGIKFYLDSSFHTVGASVGGVRFGPHGRLPSDADEVPESGTRKWAGESGADKTSTAIANSVSLSTGALAFTVSGTERLKVDGANKRIWINSGTYRAKGVQIEYNGGTPRLHVGDRNGGGPYLEYDGSDLITRTLKTSVGSVERIEINPGGNNLIEIYSDGGGGVENFATLGRTTSGIYSSVGSFGTQTVGNAVMGVHARSYSNYAIFMESVQSPAAVASSDYDWGIKASGGGGGVYAYTGGSGKYAVHAKTNSIGIPLWVQGGGLVASAAPGAVDFADDRLQVHTSSGGWTPLAIAGNLGEDKTYAFLVRTSAGHITGGQTYTGSSLRYFGFNLASSNPSGAVYGGGYGGTPDGTWQAMGSSTSNAGEISCSVFLRIY